eukprot:2138599-Amphidinium_carterae.1
MLTPVPSDHPGDDEEEGFPVEEPSPMFDDGEGEGEGEGADGDEAMDTAEVVEPEGEDLLTEEEAHSPPSHRLETPRAMVTGRDVEVAEQ